MLLFENGSVTAYRSTALVKVQVPSGPLLMDLFWVGIILLFYEMLQRRLFKTIEEEEDWVGKCPQVIMLKEALAFILW